MWFAVTIPRWVIADVGSTYRGVGQELTAWRLLENVVEVISQCDRKSWHHFDTHGSPTIGTTATGTATISSTVAPTVHSVVGMRSEGRNSPTHRDQCA